MEAILKLLTLGMYRTIQKFTAYRASQNIDLVVHSNTGETLRTRSGDPVLQELQSVMHSKCQTILSIALANSFLYRVVFYKIVFNTSCVNKLLSLDKYSLITR